MEELSPGSLFKSSVCATGDRHSSELKKMQLKQNKKEKGAISHIEVTGRLLESHAPGIPFNSPVTHFSTHSFLYTSLAM